MQQLLENIVSVKKKKKSVSVTKATGKKNQRNVNSMNGQINSINYKISVIPSDINRNSRKKTASTIKAPPATGCTSTLTVP